MGDSRPVISQNQPVIIDIAHSSKTVKVDYTTAAESIRLPNVKFVARGETEGRNCTR